MIDSRSILFLISGGGLFGIGLKLITFLGHWSFFPVFPDLFDCVFINSVAICLLCMAFGFGKHEPEKKT